MCWGKTINSAQTCIAPDCAIIQENALRKFVEGFRKPCEKFYNPNKKGIEQSKDYGRIINEQNFDRIHETLLEDAKKKERKIEYGGDLQKRKNTLVLLYLLMST